MKKWIATLLIAVLCAASFAGGQKVFAASASDIKDGDIVTFGSYPQSLVTDSALIKKLDDEGLSFYFYPYYSKNTSSTSSVYPTKQDTDPQLSMMFFADFTYNGKKYRAVKIRKYRPIDVLKIPDSEYKQQINGYAKDTVYYFEYQPIRWIVLDKNKGILLSEKVLDAQPFNAYYKLVNGKAMSAVEGGENASASNYYYSTVRHWLNADSNFDPDYGRANFLNTAFSTSEKTALSTYSVSVLDGSASRNAIDYVFLLPQSAVNSYKSRITSSDNTDYAESQGMSKRGAGTGTPWYLATMTDNTNVYYMQDQSIKSSSNSAYFSVITSTQTGIRPAIKVDLSNANVVGPFKISTQPNADTGIPSLTWASYPGAKSYEVYRCPENSNLSSEASWSKVATLGSGATEYSDPNAKAENTYYYRVRAVLADRTETSNIVHVNCALPRPVISMGNRDNETGLPKVTWKAVEGATEYEIYRREDGSSELQYVTAVTANTASTQTYLDTSGQVEVGKVYYYRIKALSRSSVYNSAYSVEKSIRCTLAAPAPITKDDSSDGMPKLSWPAVSGAYRYLIQYKKSSDTEWKSGLANSTSYVLPNCEPGATYNYKVIAQYFYPNQQTTPFDSAPNSGSITCAAKPEFTDPAKVHAAFSGRSQIFLKVGSKGKGLEFKWWFKRPLSGSNAYELEFTSGVNVSTNGCSYSLMPYTKDDGAQYYVVVTDKFGRTATSPTSNIVVFTNPKDTTVKVGETAYFSVASQYSGYIASLTYQWQSRKPGSSEWTNSSQPGAKTATLAVNASAGLNGWEFRCVVSGSNISTIYSYGATLNVEPKITKQPESLWIKAGDTAKFTVAVTGKAPFTYQWQSRKNYESTWTNSGQSGAKTATLSVAPQNGLHGWQFRCIIKDANGQQVISNTAFLYINPKITQQPKNVFAAPGTTAKFTVAATGKGPLKYQWQSRKNADAVWTNSGQPGAKTATLSVSATEGLNGWQFQCIVTDANNMMTPSNIAILSTKANIVAQPANQTVKVGDTAKFTVTAAGKGTLTYQWQSRKGYSGTWANSSQPGAKTATLSVTATAGLHGWQFRCVVTDANGKTAVSREATLSVLPKVTKQPSNLSVAANTTAKFTVTATGKAPLTYQWQSRKNSSSTWTNSGQPGAKTATLSVNATAGLNGWQFRCLVSDSNGMCSESNPATLTVKK